MPSNTFIATWLAADGSALLATKRVRGDPCGGCQVTQELIELDQAPPGENNYDSTGTGNGIQITSRYPRVWAEPCR